MGTKSFTKLPNVIHLTLRFGCVLGKEVPWDPQWVWNCRMPHAGGKERKKLRDLNISGCTGAGVQKFHMRPGCMYRIAKRLSNEIQDKTPFAMR